MVHCLLLSDNEPKVIYVFEVDSKGYMTAEINSPTVEHNVDLSTLGVSITYFGDNIEAEKSVILFTTAIAVEIEV